jgi:methionyl-tRNA formyltransferase
MRAVVFAYHNMGILGLRALLAHGYTVPLVFSHEDDPAENRWFGSVAALCRELRIPVHLPKDVNVPPWPDLIREAHPDLLFSFYYRSILSPEILSIPRLCGLNLHGSLLPRYRGRAPVNWVLVNGETETGVTLHVMAAKPDAGDIVGQETVSIDFEDTAFSLFGKMERAAARLLAGLLPQIAEGRVPRRPNEIANGSYFGGRKPQDGRIDWSAPAVRAYNLVRAVTRPYPGAFSHLGGEKCLVWRAWPLPAGPPLPALPPGRMEVLPEAVLPPSAGAGRGPGPRVAVGTGDGLLVLEEVEWKGRTAVGPEVCALLGEEIERGFP